ncbi:NUDIX hydrolase domain-like protein, partial [Thelephora terrestris]
NGRGAVLILLFEKEGSLRVLLTTRSKNLRSHPGQTALPGGMYDETDESLVATAYREAFEEIALDTTSPHLRTIITLPPFISSKKVIVTPTIALLRDPSVLDTLVPSPAEVDLIFDHPVKAFLDPTIASGEHLAPMGSEQWVWESELHDFQDFNPGAIVGRSYRMHRFRSTGSPITGLTADIMIFVAEVGYNAKTTFERWAPSQPTSLESVLLVVGGEAEVYWRKYD